MIDKFIAALPQAASSPYALVAYLFLLATAAYIGVAQHRLKTISGIIKDIPAKDRAALIAREYNTTPSKGMTAEEWIRARRQMMLFWLAMAALCAVLVVVVVALREFGSESGARQQGNLVKAWKEAQLEIIAQLQVASANAAQLSPEQRQDMAALAASLNAINGRLAAPETASKQFAASVPGLLASAAAVAQPGVNRLQAAIEAGDLGAAKAEALRIADASQASAVEALLVAGRLAEAQGRLLSARDSYERAYRASPADERTVDALQRLSFQTARYPDALRLARELEQRRAALPEADPAALDAKLRSAAVLLALNDFGPAEQAYRQLEDLLSRHSLEHSSEYAQVQNNLGSLYLNWGRYDAAGERYRRALPIYVDLAGQRSPDVGRVMNNLGYLDTLLLRLPEARTDLATALDIFGGNPKAPDLVPPLANLARVAILSRSFPEAGQVMEQGSAICREEYANQHPNCARLLDLGADLNIRMGRFPFACDLAEASMRIKAAILGPDSLEYLQTAVLEGRCKLGTGDCAGAAQNATAAYNGITAALGADNVRSAAAVELLGELAAAKGDVATATHEFNAASKLYARFAGPQNPLSEALAQRIDALATHPPISVCA